MHGLVGSAFNGGILLDTEIPNQSLTLAFNHLQLFHLLHFCI